MVFIGRSSHYGDTFTVTRSLVEKNEQFRLSSDRLNNARRFPELADYRAELPELLSHNNRIERSERNGQRLEKVLTITRAYDQALGLDNGGLQGHIDPLLTIVRDGLDPGTDLAEWRRRNFGNDNFDNRLRSIRGLLNTRIGQRYIFAGARYTQQPVKDLTSLGVPPSPTSDAAGYSAFLARNRPSGDLVADHDVGAVVPPVGIAAARQESILQVSEDQKIRYGVSSNESSINDLLLAARLVRRALASDTDLGGNAADVASDRQKFLEDARDILVGSEIDLRLLRQSAASVIPTVQLAQERERTFVSLTRSLVSRITYFDTNRAGIELAALTTQFSATLQTVRTRQSLSLVNFL